MNEQMTLAMQANTWWIRVWDFMTGPHGSIHELVERRQARLLAALSFVLLVVTGLGMWGSWAANALNQGSALLISMVLGSSLSYVLSRTTWHKLGSTILVTAISASGYISALMENYDLFTATIASLPLAFLLGIAILSLRRSVIFTVVNILAPLALFLFPTPNISDGDIWGVFGQALAMGGLFLVVQWFRDSLERERINEVLKTSDQLQQLSASLEQRVAERTRDIALAAEIGRRITMVRDLNTLLSQAVELIRERFNLYYTQIYLVDPRGQNLAMRAGTGRIGEEMLRRGHRLAMDLTSLNGSAALERRPVIVEDTARSLIFRPNPLLPDTRSELAIPLIAGERVLGVLDLQSSTPGALTSDDLPAFETLAGQIATALLNAELFEQVQRSLVDMETHNRQVIRQGWDAYLNGIDQKERLGYVYEAGATSPLGAPLVSDADPLKLSTEIKVTGEPVGILQLEGDMPWSTDAVELVNVVAAQLAQQVENLRLLDQAERYRKEMEVALRRATREEWEGYIAGDESKAFSFQYDGNQVIELSSAEAGNSLPAVGLNGDSNSAAIDITVQEETIGQIGLLGVEELTPEDQELVSAISEQLSAHLENMRLFNTAQRELEERRRTESSLRTATDQLSEALDAARMANWEFDLNTGNFIFNDRFYEFLGTTAEAEGGYLMPAPVYASKYVHPDDAAQVGANVQEAIITSDPNYRYEGLARSILANGEVRDVIVRFSIEKDAEGRTVRLFGANQDVTEQRRQEEIIARRATELATVSQMATTIATILNPDSMLQTVVDLTKASFGLYHAHIYMLNEAGDTLVLAKGAGEVGRQMVAEGRQISIHAEKSLVARAARLKEGVIVNDVRQDPEFLPHPLLPDTRSEMAVPMMVGDRLLGVLDVQASITGRFTEEDIMIKSTLSAQVAIALQNARQYEHTQASEQLIRTVIDSTPDWIFIKDQQHRYRLVNQGYANSLHIQSEEFIGKDDLELGFPEELVKGNPEKGIAGFWADDRKVMDSGEATIIPNDVVMIDGQLRTLNTIKTPLRDPNGQVIGVLAFARDVTERETLLADTEALYSVTSNLARSRSHKEVLDAVVEGTVLRSFDSASVYYFDRPWNENNKPQVVVTEAVWERVPGSFPLSLGQPLPVQALPGIEDLLQHPYSFVDDARTYPDMHEMVRQMLVQAGMISSLNVRLLVGGEWVGCISATASEPKALNEQDVRRLLILIDQATTVLYGLFQYQSTQARARREQTLREITARVRSSMDPEAILRTAVRELGNALGRQAFIRLGSADQLLEQAAGNGHGTNGTAGNGSASLTGEGGK